MILTNCIPEIWKNSLFKMMYAFSFGTMIWTGYTFGDKIIIHNAHHMISRFIYFSTPLVFWKLRWDWNNKGDIPNIKSSFYTGLEFIMLTCIPYLIWLTVHTFLLFNINIFKQSSISNKNNNILINNNSILTKLKYFNISASYFNVKIFYIIVYTLANIMGIFVAGLWYNSFILNTIFVGIIGVFALYIASTYQLKRIHK